MTKKVHHTVLVGGLDLATNRLKVNPGRAVSCVNLDVGPGGYTRVAGFERFDGQLVVFTFTPPGLPSFSTYPRVVTLSTHKGETAPLVGSQIQGDTSKAAGEVLSVTLVSGSWDTGDAVADIGVNTYAGLGDFSTGETIQTTGAGTVGILGAPTVKAPMGRGVPVTYSVSFTNGSLEPSIDSEIYGFTSGCVAVVKDILLDDGAWGDGTATGVFIIEPPTGSGSGSEVQIPYTYALSWGISDNLRICDGTPAEAFLPDEGKHVPRLIGSNNDSWVYAGSLDGSSVIALRDDGSLWCMGVWPISLTDLCADMFIDPAGGYDHAYYSKMVPKILSDVSAVPNAESLQVDHNQVFNQVGADKYVAVDVGSRHYAMVKTDGSLWVSGYNTDGALGLGTVDASGLNLDRYAPVNASPVQVGALTDWHSVSCGTLVTHAIKTDGTLWSWGRNTSGQLGSNSTEHRSSPVQVGTSTDWSKVRSGYGRVFCIKTDGTLWASGDNTSGALGDGTTDNRSSLTQIGSGEDHADVAVGENWTLVLKTSGDVFSWGRNAHGTLGDGTVDNHSSHVQVGESGAWAKIAVARGTSAAIDVTGALWTWGKGATQVTVDDTTTVYPAPNLGDGAAVSRSSPVQVGSATDWSNIFSGSNFIGHVTGVRTVTETSFATPSQGTDFVTEEVLCGTPGMYAWGNNGAWSLLYGIRPLLVNSPIGVNAVYAVPGGDTTWNMWDSTGFYTTGCVKNDGTLWVWGSVYAGLGYPSDQQYSSPVQVGTLNTWSMAKFAAKRVAALKTDGTLWVWGLTRNGDLGLDVTGDAYDGRFYPDPVQVIDEDDNTWSFVALGDGHKTGNWDLGGWSMYAVDSTGGLWASGDNVYGQLGLLSPTLDSPKLHAPTLTRVGSATNWLYVTTGEYFFIGIKTDGTLWGCGKNDVGQLGVGDTVTRSAVTQIGTDTDWVAVSSGQTASAALKSDGTLHSWGGKIDRWAQYSPLGIGYNENRSSPTQIGTDTDWSSVSVGLEGMCGTKTDGTVWGWGSLSSWYPHFSLVPMQLPLPTDVHYVSVRNIMCRSSSNWDGWFAAYIVPVAICAGQMADHGAVTNSLTTLGAERSLIKRVPGNGPIRGVWVFKGGVLAFRDYGGTGLFWKSSQSGWKLVNLGITVPFTGGCHEALRRGAVITGTDSLATATLVQVNVTEGSIAAGDASGFLILTATDGSFGSEAINASYAESVAEVQGAGIPVTLKPGGKYEFVTANFYGSASTQRVYGCDGVNPGFEWDGEYFSQIHTGMLVDAPTHVAAHNSYLYFSFRGGSLQNSGIGNPFGWTPILGAAEIGVGQEITALLSQVQVLTIFCKNQISNLYGSGEGDWMLQVLYRDSGAFAGTIQQMLRPVFMDDAGLRYLENTQAIGDFKLGTLTVAVESWLRSKRRKGVMPTCSVRVRDSDTYRVFFSDGTGLSVYLGGGGQPQFTEISFGKPILVACSEEDAFGVMMLLFGSDDGYIYQMDAGDSFDGNNIVSTVQLPYAHFGSPGVVKRWQSVSFDMDAVPGTEFTLNAFFDNDTKDSVPVEGETLTAFGGEGRSGSGYAVADTALAQSKIVARIAGRGNDMSVRLSNTANDVSAYTLQSVTHEYTPLKRKR